MIERMIAHDASGSAGSISVTEGVDDQQRWEVIKDFPPPVFHFSSIYPWGFLSANTFTYCISNEKISTFLTRRCKAWQVYLYCTFHTQ